MAVYGDYQGSGGNLAADSNQFERDVVRELYYKEADLAPLTLLLRKAKSRPAESFKHEWAESDDLAQYTQINNSGGYTAGATSLVVDDSSIIALTSILVNQRTNETMRVTANNTSTNTVTVTRSWGGTAAAAINDNDYVSVLGTTPAEGADSNVGIAVNESFKHNFVQEFRDSFGVTWIGQKSKTYHGDLLARRRKERGRDHKKAIELAMFYGERNRDTGSDEAFASMGGLKEFITTNVTSFGSIVTFDAIVDAAETDFEYGSDRKLLFVGRAGYSGVAKVATDTIRSGKVADTMGLKLEMLEAQHGTYIMHKHRLFRGNEYTKRGFVIDPDKVRRSPMRDLDTRLRTGLESNSATARKEEWYTAVTMERILEDCHAIWNDLA